MMRQTSLWLLAVLPLILSVRATNCFEYVKNLVFLAAVLLLVLQSTLAADRVRAGFAALKKLWTDRTALGVICFAASAIISTLTASNVRIALYGAEQSSEGLFTLLAYVLFFFLLRGAIRHLDDVRTLLLGPAFACVVLLVYATFQWCHLDPISWKGYSQYGSAIRIFASMGNPGFFAAYLVMALPFLVMTALQLQQHKRGAAAILGYIIIAACVLEVVLSLTRAAWLALAVASVVFVRLRPVSLKLPRRSLTLYLSLGALLLGFLALLPASRFVFDLIQQRLHDILSGRTRLLLWRQALAMFWAHPWCGVGVDCFQAAFPSVRDPAYMELEWATSAKAHNAFIHVLATQGILGGLAVLLVLWGMVERTRALLRRATPVERSWIAAVAASAAAFVTQAAFSFVVLGCGTLFVLCAAVLSKETLLGTEGVPRDRAVWPLAGAAVAFAISFLDSVGLVHATDYSTAVGVCCVVVSCGLALSYCLSVSALDAPAPKTTAAVPMRFTLSNVIVYCVWALAIGIPSLLLPPSWLPLHPWLGGIGVRPFVSSKLCREGMTLLSQAAPGGSQAYAECVAAAARLEVARKLEPQLELPLQQLAIANYAVALNARNKDEQMQRLYTAERYMQECLGAFATNPYNWTYLGRMEYDLARAGADRAHHTAQAFAALDRAIELDPNNADFYGEAFAIARDLDDRARATQYVQASLLRYPRYAPALLQKARWALGAGRLEEGRALLEQSLQGIWGATPQTADAQLLLAGALVKLGRYDEALPHADECLRERPDSVPGRYCRILALKGLGRTEEARNELNLLSQHR